MAIPSFARGALVVGVACLAGCTSEPLAVDLSPTDTLNVAYGQQFEIDLSTVSPGGYDSFPVFGGSTIGGCYGSCVIRFLDMSPVGTTIQRFRFQAVSPGHISVGFRHRYPEYYVSYVVAVP